MAFIVGGITVVISVSALKTRFYSRSGLFFQRKILDWVCVSSSADGDVEERFFFCFFLPCRQRLYNLFDPSRGGALPSDDPPHTHTHTAPLFKIHLFLIPILRWMLTLRVCRIKGSEFTSDSLSQSLFWEIAVFVFFLPFLIKVWLSAVWHVCVCVNMRGQCQRWYSYFSCVFVSCWMFVLQLQWLLFVSVLFVVAHTSSHSSFSK